ncbi:PAS domain-containing protein [Siccirubricoccus deserti]
MPPQPFPIDTKPKEAPSALSRTSTSPVAGSMLATAALDGMELGVYCVDRDGACTFVNRAGCAMLGYDRPEELLGRNMHDLIHHTRADGTLSAGGMPAPAHGCGGPSGAVGQRGAVAQGWFLLRCRILLRPAPGRWRGHRQCRDLP